MSPSAAVAWAVPLCSTRLGASHRRRSAVCQDCSAVRTLRSADGRPVQLMAVADGHGGHRYHHSDVGSRLACEVALEAAAETLERSDVGFDFGGEAAGADGVEGWGRWLAHELPTHIVDRWLEAVEAHWRSRPGEGAAPFSPLPYGTTLALVVMTPGWWGYTGLGDWDLVRVDGEDAAQLLSEEGEMAGDGEATFSLCLEEAASRFADRSAVHCLPLPAQPEPPFWLVLSTDGIRKSCVSDADHLHLARHLADLVGPAVGRPERKQALNGDLDQITDQGSGDDVSVAIGHWGPPVPRPQPFPGRPALALLLLLALGAGASRLWSAHQPRLEQTPLQRRIAAEVQRLCRNPQLVAGTLSQRRSQFQGLRAGTIRGDVLRAGAEADPLGAVIAIGYDPGRGSLFDPQALAALKPCEALLSALTVAWQAAAASPPAVSSPPRP